MSSPFSLGFTSGFGVGFSPVTAQDIIKDALEMLGVLAPGETLTAADGNRALVRLNDMMDSWSNETLTCFQEIEQSTPLIAGQQTYTIGPGGNVNVPRPLRIKDGPGAAYVQDGNGNNYALNVVPLDEWNLIGNRAPLFVNSNVPEVLFYDPAFPLGNLNFYPTPNMGGFTAFWDSYLPFSTFSGLTSPVLLPPGYVLAMKTNLAVHLKPYFLSAQLDPDVRAIAMESKANIKRTNKRMNMAEMEPELVARSGFTYNIYTDRSST